jgi:anti-anti-sigma factor
VKIETKIVNDVTIFIINGDFTCDCLEPIRDALKNSVDSAITARFLVDFSLAGDLDSSGVGTLISIYKRVLSRQGIFAVIAPNGKLKQVFFDIGLNRLFQIFDGESQAILHL